MTLSRKARKITDRKGRQWTWTYSDLGELLKLGRHEIERGLKDKFKYRISSGPNKSDQEYPLLSQAMAACEDATSAE